MNTKAWGFNAEQDLWISRVVGSVSENSPKHISLAGAKTPPAGKYWTSEDRRWATSCILTECWDPKNGNSGGMVGRCRAVPFESSSRGVIAAIVICREIARRFPYESRALGFQHFLCDRPGVVGRQLLHSPAYAPFPADCCLGAGRGGREYLSGKQHRQPGPFVVLLSAYPLPDHGRP